MKIAMRWGIYVLDVQLFQTHLNVPFKLDSVIKHQAGKRHNAPSYALVFPPAFCLKQPCQRPLKLQIGS